MANTEYARVENGKVVERLSLDSAIDLRATFSKEFLSSLKECGSNVLVGWVYSKGKFSHPEETPTPEPVTVVNSIDLWSRMEDDEADQVGDAMASQSFRIRQIFQSAATYRSDHELWPLLTSIAVTLFGEARAAEILAPSTGA